MKTIGIIRRMDDLGRVAIPREIRNKLNMVDGCSIEIFIDNDTVCLKKYSAVQTYREKMTDLLISINDGLADIEFETKKALTLKIKEVLTILEAKGE